MIFTLAVFSSFLPLSRVIISSEQALNLRMKDETSFLLMRSYANERKGKLDSSLADAIKSLGCGKLKDQLNILDSSHRIRGENCSST